MKFLLFILVIIDNVNVALANNDNCGLNDLNALMVRLRQLRTDFNALKTQHEATQAEIKVLKEANRKQETANRKQETELEELRQDVNNNSTEIAEISKVIEIIKDIDDCSPNQCQNEATCVDGVTSYTCSCVAGYNGTLCEIGPSDGRTEAITSKEKGTAKLFRMLFNIEEIRGRSLFGMRKGNRESDARPSCADKAKLKFLEDIDDCNPNPCQNGATCTDGVDSYTCTCVTGYTGTNCETDIDDCTSNLCKNGATCNDGVNSYTCMCSPGYTGTYCDTDINECNPDPCQNGATCTDRVDSYTCTCVARYTGTNCETAKCPADWYFFRESCYFRSTKDLAWLEAEKDCVALGGHLVEITSEQENDFIKWFMPSSYVWIGLNDRVTESVFVWESSGSKVSGLYTHWLPGQPYNSDKDCVRMSYSTGYWYIVYCTHLYHYICEKKSITA